MSLHALSVTLEIDAMKIRFTYPLPIALLLSPLASLQAADEAKSKPNILALALANPLFLASGLAPGSLNGLNPKSKFLAFTPVTFNKLGGLTQLHAKSEKNK